MIDDKMLYRFADEAAKVHGRPRGPLRDKILTRWKQLEGLTFESYEDFELLARSTVEVACEHNDMDPSVGTDTLMGSYYFHWRMWSPVARKLIDPSQAICPYPRCR